jgi:hypothetical protein
MLESTNKNKFLPIFTHLLALAAGAFITYNIAMSYIIDDGDGGHDAVCCVIKPDNNHTSISGDEYEFLPLITVQEYQVNYGGDGTDSSAFRGINIPAELICGLYHQYCEIDDRSKSAYRVYYGKNPTGQHYGSIYPLAKNYYLEMPLPSVVLSVQVPSEPAAIGPCPMNCFGDASHEEGDGTGGDGGG